MLQQWFSIIIYIDFVIAFLLQLPFAFHFINFTFSMLLGCVETSLP